jgi:hypothetical protein
MGETRECTENLGGNLLENVHFRDWKGDGTENTRMDRKEVCCELDLALNYVQWQVLGTVEMNLLVSLYSSQCCQLTDTV